MSRRGLVLGLVAAVLAACGGPAASTPAPAPTTTPTTAPTRPPIVVSPSAALLGSPPIARLAVEGGDAVEGQLGTYTWANGGSESPWLPGAPIAAGAGEPLTMTFEPPIGVTAWLARIVPAGADGPAGARTIGEGGGTPRFEAPASGAWTLEVQVTFPAGMGRASYAWALTVP